MRSLFSLYIWKILANLGSKDPSNNSPLLNMYWNKTHVLSTFECQIYTLLLTSIEITDSSAQEMKSEKSHTNPSNMTCS